MKSFAETLKQALTANQEYAFLVQTQKASEFEVVEIREVLEAAFNPDKNIKPSDKLNSRLFGVFLSSVFLQRRFVFMTTQETFVKLLKANKDISRRTINGEEFKAFNHWMLINKFIEVVRQPKKGDRRAGVYKLAHPELRALLGLLVNLDVEKAQEAQCIEILEDLRKSTEKTSEKITGEEEEVLEVEIEERKQTETVKEEPNKILPSPTGQAADASLKNSNSLKPTSLGKRPIDDPFASIPLAQKIDLILGSKAFAIVVANTVTKRDYLAIFQNFRQLLVTKNELTSDQARMVTDWLIKVTKRERESLMYDYLTIVDEMAKSGIELGSSMWVDDMEVVYGIMERYLTASKTADDAESDRIFQVMTEALEAIAKEREFHLPSLWVLVKAMAQKFHGKPDYLSDILAKRHSKQVS